MNKKQKREIVATLLKAGRRDLAEKFVRAGAVDLGDGLVLNSRATDQGTEVFKFTGQTKKGDVAMFTVMLSPSGLLSTKNTKGIPKSQHVHLATMYVKKNK